MRWTVARSRGQVLALIVGTSVRVVGLRGRGTQERQSLQLLDNHAHHLRSNISNMVVACTVIYRVGAFGRSCQR